MRQLELFGVVYSKGKWSVYWYWFNPTIDYKDKYVPYRYAF